MKNIVIISEEYLHYGNTAGVNRMNMYAKALLLNKETSVYTIPYTSNCNIKNCKLIYSGLSCFESDTEFIRAKGLRIIKQVFQFLVNIDKFSRTLKGDVIYYYYPASGSFLDLFCVFYIKYYLKKKIYLEVNEVRKYATTPVYSNLKKVKKVIVTFLLDQTFHFYDGLISISENIARFYKSKNKNILVIPILCDVSKPFNGDGNSIVKNSIQRPIVFLFAGSVAFEKENLEELIKGFALILNERENVLLHFYGSITEDSMNKINALIKKLEINNYVEYCGPYNNDKVFDVLKKADALIMPRNNSKQNYYGFSTKLAEYSISGIPIIMTNTGVIDTFFKDGFNCIITDGYDSNSFYVKMKYFLTLSKKEKEFIFHNAYETSVKFFDLQIHSDAINKFLI